MERWWWLGNNGVGSARGARPSSSADRHTHQLTPPSLPALRCAGTPVGGQTCTRGSR